MSFEELAFADEEERVGLFKVSEVRELGAFV